MIPEIKKILYATDLSPNAVHAFAYAASLANRYDAGITVLHVLEELSASSNIQLAEMLGREKLEELQQQKRQSVKDTIARRLETFCSEMEAELAECPFLVQDSVVRRGNPAEQILQEARERESDLIVMGTHGQGPLADMVMGSTARRVARLSTIPVMTVRLPA
jgi:nucleotide-binding universal stress UspA family protein